MPNTRKTIRNIKKILFLFLRFLSSLNFSVTILRAARSAEIE
jgi:hypothetical protein